MPHPATLAPPTPAPAATPTLDGLLVELSGGLATVDLRRERRFTDRLRGLWDGTVGRLVPPGDRPLVDWVATLPFNAAVLDLAAEHREQGTPVLLTSDLDAATVQAVADHFGVFDGVVTRAPGTPPTPERLAIVRTDLAPAGGLGDVRLGYVGPPAHAARLTALAAADAVWTTGLEKSGRFGVRPWADRPSPASRLRGQLRVVVKAMRVQQYVKNLLVFLPMLFAHRFGDVAAWIESALAFVCLSLAASSIYLPNDRLDVAADRQHPRKRHRPLASGALSFPAGLALFVGLAAAALTLAVTCLPLAFLGWLLAYVGLSTVYSGWLKTKLLVDVITLSGLFTIRIIAGGAACDNDVSTWLLAFSGFFFLSLATCKRHVEMKHVGHGGGRRAYLAEDVAILRTLGLATGTVAILVLALYIHNSQAGGLALYARPEWIWLVCPVLFYWIGRVWMLSERGVFDTDPLVFASKDRVSYACLAMVVALFFLAGPVHPTDVTSAEPARPVVKSTL